MRQGWRRSNVPRGQLETITAGILDKKKDNIVMPEIRESEPNEDGWMFHSEIVSEERPFCFPIVHTHSVTLNDFSLVLLL